MAATKIRAKQSQHSHEHLFASLALLLHFTFDFSVSVGGRHYKLLAYGVLRSFQNALVESKILHVLQTLLCDVTNGRPSLLPLKKCNGPLRELKAL